MLAEKMPAATALQPRTSSLRWPRLLPHARSHLRFDAWCVQDPLKPGFAVALYASLSEYNVPMERRVNVWAEVTRPDQSAFRLPLARGADGVYKAGFLTTAGGVYTCRVRADGYAFKGTPFTREQTLTAGSLDSYADGQRH